MFRCSDVPMFHTQVSTYCRRPSLHIYKSYPRSLFIVNFFFPCVSLFDVSLVVAIVPPFAPTWTPHRPRPRQRRIPSNPRPKWAPIDSANCASPTTMDWPWPCWPDLCVAWRAAGTVSGEHQTEKKKKKRTVSSGHTRRCMYTHGIKTIQRHGSMQHRNPGFFRFVFGTGSCTTSTTNVYHTWRALVRTELYTWAGTVDSKVRYLKVKLKKKSLVLIILLIVFKPERKI